MSYCFFPKISAINDIFSLAYPKRRFKVFKKALILLCSESSRQLTFYQTDANTPPSMPNLVLLNKKIKTTTIIFFLLLKDIIYDRLANYRAFFFT